MIKAVGKDAQARDVYREEHERALGSLAEAEAFRKATQLNPTEEDETADVLRRRLLDDVDRTAATTVCDGYAQTWNNNRASLPHSALARRRGYAVAERRVFE